MEAISQGTGKEKIEGLQKNSKEKLRIQFMEMLRDDMH